MNDCIRDIVSNEIVYWKKGNRYTLVGFRGTQPNVISFNGSVLYFGTRNENYYINRLNKPFSFYPWQKPSFLRIGTV